MNSRRFMHLAVTVLILLLVSCGSTETVAVDSGDLPSTSPAAESESIIRLDSEDKTATSSNGEGTDAAISESPTSPAVDSHVEDWVIDIEYFRESLLNVHLKFQRHDTAQTLVEAPLLYKNRRWFEETYGTVEDNKDFFNWQVDNLIGDLPELSDVQIKFRLHEICVSLGDYHTYIPMYDPEKASYPLVFRVFDNDCYVYGVRQDSGLEQALGCRVAAINGVDIFDVLAKTLKINSGDNGSLYTPMALLYGQIYSLEILQYLGIVDEDERAVYTLIGNDGVTFDVEAYPTVTRTAFVDEEWIYDQRHGEERLFEQKSDLYYWQEYIENDGIQYIRYSRCLEMPQQKLSVFYDRVLEMYDSSHPKKLVLDLRFNQGGWLEYTTMQEFFEKIRSRAEADECLVYTFIDNRTSSAAIWTAYLARKHMGAVLIGTPTINPAMFFNTEYDTIVLPNSKIEVNHSVGMYPLEFVSTEEPVSVLRPDIYIEDTYEDFINQYDRVYETIKEY